MGLSWVLLCDCSHFAELWIRGYRYVCVSSRIDWEIILQIFHFYESQ